MFNLYLNKKIVLSYYLIIAICIALWLRVENIGYGLPSITHPDEVIVKIALEIADPARPTLDPGFYNYPAFQLYIYSACFYIYGVVSRNGSWQVPHLPDKIKAVYFARIITTFFGVATVALVYWLGVLFDSRLTGILAAFFLAITPFHALDSHYANVDIPMAFWFVLSLVFIFRYLQSRHALNFFIAAACIGLSGATKYSGLFAMMVIPAAAFFLYRNKYDKFFLYAAGGCVVVVAFFIMGAPYTVLSFEDALKTILYERMHVRSGHWGFDTTVGGGLYKPFIYQMFAGLPFVLGIPIYIFSIAGFFSAFFLSCRQKFFLLLAGCIPMTVFIFKAVVVFPRYLIPLLPIAALLTGFFFANFFTRKSHVTRLAVIALFTITAAYSFIMTKSLADGLMPQNATRASSWIENNVRAGSEIAVGIYIPQLSLPPNTYSIVHLDSILETNNKPEWLVISSWYDKAWKRGNLANSKTNAFLRSLGTHMSDYESVVIFKTTFFHEAFYVKLDPYFGNYFQSPDISIFRLKRLKNPTE